MARYASPAVGGRPQIARWEESGLRRLLAKAAYPLVWALNRPAMAGVGHARDDLALRCNGIAINYKGRHGPALPEERFLARIAPGLGRGTVLDVGANTGSYARLLRQLAPQARIFAFEPHPRTYAELVEKLADARVETINAALGESEGTLTLYDFAAADGSIQASLSRESVELYSSDLVRHEVRCTTLDNFLEAQGIERVAFLKVDTEGFDLDVLRGATAALASKRIDLIQFEFIAANVATGVRMRDFFDLLDGYSVARLCLNGEELPLGRYSVKFNEIYVNQNLVARPAR